ncbi:MAG TPA: DUF4931 domain-containing protein [Thermoanaerobaculia bacterium]|nr:DUF4931 domain-containing protein [Thermoanaerobaculia bacterium]
MSLLLLNPITGLPVILAPERGARPNALQSATNDQHASAACPFCAGNEDQTPPEIIRLSDAESWDVRVVPNKYPFMSMTGTQIRGHHEVIIESGEHDARWENQSVDHIERIVTSYKSRFDALSADAEYVLLFKNFGPRSGQSIDHLHSQIVSLPFVPEAAVRESEGFDRQEREGAGCPLCRLHLSADNLRIATTPAFQIVSAPAARFPYEIWIVPDRHAETFVDVAAADIGRALTVAVTALVQRWPSISYNWEFRQFARRGKACHWYVAIEPRLTTMAGFELATGMWINIVPPRQAASELREHIEGAE